MSTLTREMFHAYQAQAKEDLEASRSAVSVLICAGTGCIAGGAMKIYENFSLEAKGKHIIKVCAGTACHVRKSQPIYDAIYEYLSLKGKRRTADDGMFTLETVACLGACGLAPVMTVDGEVYPQMSPEAALKLLEDIRKKEAQA